MILAMTPVELTLKALRAEARLTQAQLAEAVGVRQATINDLENGKSRRIEFDLIDALCRVLGKRLDRTIEPGDLIVRRRASRTPKPPKQGAA